MRRIFDATPRFMVYLIGIVVVSFLSLPYLLDWLPSLQEKAHFTLASDLSDTITIPDKRPARLIASASESAASPLSHFGEIRLNASREEMLRSASMRLLTTYGAAPEIYESSTINDVDHFTGCFSGGLLKEAFVFQHETQCSAEKLQQDLKKQFGSPMNQIDSTGATAMPALVNPDTAKDWISRLATLPLHRSLVWSDANYRVEATIYYSSADPAQSRSIMAIHMHATTSPSNQTLSQYTTHTISSQPAVE